MTNNRLLRQLFAFSVDQDKDALDKAINLFLQDNKDECDKYDIPQNTLVNISNHGLLYFMESTSKQNYCYMEKGNGIYLRLMEVEELLVKELADGSSDIIKDLERYVIRIPYEECYDLEYGNYLNKRYGFIRTNFLYMILKKYNKDHVFLNIYKYNSTVMKSDYKKEIITVRF